MSRNELLILVYQWGEKKILALPTVTRNLFLFNIPLNAFSFSICQGLSSAKHLDIWGNLLYSMKHIVSYLPICPIDIKHILKVKCTIKGLAELKTKLFIKVVRCKHKMSRIHFYLNVLYSWICV